jgi:dolichyl-diphosphooligosaccharide--protein glycosyltransferase
MAKMPAIVELLFISLKISALLVFFWSAYKIRLHAVTEYGRVIHEFDPWFNFRSTQYLAENGWTAFFHWFDHRSWYPLGRPVGTTIYPGMQIVSVVLWKVLNWVGVEMSLNDVCVFVPAWFGVSATAFLALLTTETTGSTSAGVASAGIMAIIPAHIMRSVAGGYDNESVAITAMMMTFYFWCRALRNDESWWIAFPTAFAYIFMVAAWGGYIFVINMIGIHVLLLLVMGRHTTKLWKVYTIVYVLGTLGATRVPVVGWAPLKSMEQLGPFGIFVLVQMVEFVEVQRRAKNLTNAQVTILRLQLLGAVGAGFALLIAILLPTGYFGPLSARVRGLFLRHTRTGNPLVDSVAEHQPASSQAYWQYLHLMCYFAPVGFIMCLQKITDSKSFLLIFTVVSYYFSIKMMRLILLMGPVAASLGGVCLGGFVEWAICQLFNFVPETEEEEDDEDEKVEKRGKAAEKDEVEVMEVVPSKGGSKVANQIKLVKKRQGRAKDEMSAYVPDDFKKIYKLFKEAKDQVDAVWNLSLMKVARMVGAAIACFLLFGYMIEFNNYSQSMAVGMSNPSIMYKAQLRNGQYVLIDDYRDAYFWLRDNTPKDSRVMAWWDYGYQIAGIANRVTIADGNTWNHEHIATLGKCLSSEETKAHGMTRHLADYVLIWTGGGGDDLAKSPHMARIGNSVYHDICPGDPTCRQFGFSDREGTPTPMMAQSMLYKMHSHNQKPGVYVNPDLFREVYTSKYNKVRIYKVLHVSKKSRKWVANPENRKCDAPGSWYCVGNYPPALDDLIANRSSFKQLEDFNTKRTGKDDEYHKEYMRRMSGGGGAREPGEKPYELQFAPNGKDDAQWADTPLTTMLWSLVHANKVKEFRALIKMEPNVVHVRSGDGRGPLWWAYEYGRGDVVKLLLTNGIDPNAVDGVGVRPKSMLKMKK